MLFLLLHFSIEVSALEIIFCAFSAQNYFLKALIPLKGVLKRVPFIGVRL